MSSAILGLFSGVGSLSRPPPGKTDTGLIVWAVLLVFLVVGIIIVVSLAAQKRKPQEVPQDVTGITGVSISTLGSQNTGFALAPDALAAPLGAFFPASKESDAVRPGSLSTRWYGDGRHGVLSLKDERHVSLKQDTFLESLSLVRSSLCTNGYRLFVKGTLEMEDASEIFHRGHGAFGAPAGTLGGGWDGEMTAPSPPIELSSTQLKCNGVSSPYQRLSEARRLRGTFRAESERLIELACALDANATLDVKQPLLYGGARGGPYDAETRLEGGGGGGFLLVCAREIKVKDGTCLFDVSGGRVGKAGSDPKIFGNPGEGGIVLVRTGGSKEFLKKLQFNVSSGPERPRDGVVWIWGEEEEKGEIEEKEEKEATPVSGGVGADEKASEAMTKTFTETLAWTVSMERTPLSDSTVIPLTLDRLLDESPFDRTQMEDMAACVRFGSSFLFRRAGVFALAAQIQLAATTHQTSGTVEAWFQLERETDANKKQTRSPTIFGLARVPPNPLHGQFLSLSAVRSIPQGSRVSLMIKQRSGHVMFLVNTREQPTTLSVTELFSTAR